MAIAASILALPLLGVGGMALDYVYLYRLEANLQKAADSAALSSARELGLANANAEILNSVAQNYVFTNLGQEASPEDTAIAAVTSTDRSEIKVSVSHTWEPLLLHFLDSSALPIKVSATAKLAGKTRICLLGLDPNRAKSIHLRKNAQLSAPECGVYSNSTNKTAIRVDNNAKLISGITCTAGGFRGKKSASFTPAPITDCPTLTDPLAERPKPKRGSCDHKRFKVNTGSHILFPGTYCKGLEISGDAEVWLKPGIYVITGGKLQVTDQGSLEGEHVGFYLNGDKAKLRITKETNISLSAPVDGLLAGILVFEDRTASDSVDYHHITSDNARVLLGTILPSKRCVKDRL